MLGGFSVATARCRGHRSQGAKHAWPGERGSMKALLFANTDWYLYNFRRPLMRELKRRGFTVVLLAPRGPYGERLAGEGVRWCDVPMERRSLNPLKELRLFIRLVQIYRHERPDIVHHFTLKCVIYGALAARLCGVERRINAVTGLGYVYVGSTVIARLLRPWVQALLRTALAGRRSRLVVQNVDDQSLFLRAGMLRSSQVTLIRGSGVCTKQFSPRALHSRHGRPFTVLMATRLLREKGVVEYVAAARRLQESSEGQPIDFWLAGLPDEGNPSAIAVSMLQQWQRHGLIKWLGHVEDMARLFDDVDAVVLPSYYREGTPKVLLEASASGLAIITTDVPGCREVVEHGVTGILVPPRDVDSLERAIRYLWKHPGLRSSLGRAARAKAVAEFDERQNVADTYRVYEELLENDEAGRESLGGAANR